MPRNPRSLANLRRGGGTGRKKGVPNYATREAKLACAELIDDPVYRAKLKQRLLRGTLPSALECLIWYYAKGKPREDVTVDATLEISWKTRGCPA